MSNLQKGLVGHWPLNNLAKKSDTITRDTTPNGNNGTLTGGQTYTNDLTTGRTGRTGDALNFDGSVDYIVVPYSSDFDLTSAISISVWIKADATTGNDWIVDRSFPTSYSMLRSATDLEFYIGGTLTNATGIVSTNTWYHIVGTYDGTNQKLYVDNILKDSDTSTLSSNGNALGIGGTYGGTSTFDGSIQDVRIYNRALSALEVKQLFDEYKPSGDANAGDLYKGLVLDMPLKSKNEKVGTDLAPASTCTSGSGEADVTTGWTNSGFATFASDTEGTEPSGTHSLHLVANSSGDWARNTSAMTTVIGKSYRLTTIFKIANGDAGSAMRMVLGTSSGGAEYNVGDAYTDANWNTDTFEFTATATTFWMYFEERGADDDVDVYIDVVSLKEIQTADLTPNSNHGVVYGATVGADSTSFAGSPVYVDVGNTNDVGTGDFSINYWINKSGTSQAAIISKGVTNPKFINVIRTDNQIDLEVYDSAGSLSWAESNNTITDSSWYNIGAVAERNQLIKLYINGAETTYDNQTNATGSDLTNTGSFYIGQYNNSQYLLGSLSNVKLYNRALSALEVKQLYDNGRF